MCLACRPGHHGAARRANAWGSRGGRLCEGWHARRSSRTRRRGVRAVRPHWAGPLGGGRSPRGGGYDRISGYMGKGGKWVDGPEGIGQQEYNLFLSPYPVAQSRRLKMPPPQPGRPPPAPTLPRCALVCSLVHQRGRRIHPPPASEPGTRLLPPDTHPRAVKDAVPPCPAVLPALRRSARAGIKNVDFWQPRAPYLPGRVPCPVSPRR